MRGSSFLKQEFLFRECGRDGGGGWWVVVVLIVGGVSMII